MERNGDTRDTKGWLGSVRRMGGTGRVNAQLIDAVTGAHLWAEQMDVDRERMIPLEA